MAAKTIPAKYIFLDIVNYTRGRSIEAQSDIISALNTIVQTTIKPRCLEIEENKLILLPTGDGMCVALCNANSPYDLHVLLALDIIKQLANYNATTQSTSRQFEVRMGINANVDNLVIDLRVPRTRRNSFLFLRNHQETPFAG